MENYKPQDERKKILLLSDDLRMHSGVATMSREFVVNTAHYYNWVQIAGSVKHVDKGKVLNLDASVTQATGVQDPYVRLYPTDGYGTPELLKRILSIEKPDAVLHFTDPRFWGWLYNMERELRQTVPLGYYSIWDNLPYPMWNRSFYMSCDWVGCISKQTKNIVENVLGSALNKPTTVSYVPHGINPKTFYPFTTPEENQKIETLKKFLFKKDYKYIVFYNNRNVRRKQPATTLLAYKAFCDNLPKEEAEKCVFLMHTAEKEEAGTDLAACKESFCPDYDVVFNNRKLSPEDMNVLYNMVDVTINLADNEGFGLGTAESIMAGTPIIVNVTGGMQDQCGFVDENGKLIEFTTEWATNSDGRYKKHGKWVTPIYPATRSVQGSIPTPYITADYAKWEDAAEALFYWYCIGREKRTEYGLLGREFALNEGGLNSQNMCEKMIEGLDNMMVNWKGREKFNIHRQDEYVGHSLPNKQTGFIIPRFDKNETMKKLGE
jgi:glycosyltransferase involved in cell wall biosynthesis